MKTGCWGKLVFYPMPPLAAPRIRTLVRRGERGCGLRRVRHGVAHRPDLARPVQRRGSRTPAENDVRRLLVLLAPKVHEKLFFILTAFRCRKAAKATRPIPMSASGRLKAASGDYSQVCKQTVPAAVAFSLPFALSPSEPSRESPCGVKRMPGHMTNMNNAAVGGTTIPHSRLTRKKRVRAAARLPRGGAKA